MLGFDVIEECELQDENGVCKIAFLKCENLCLELFQLPKDGMRAKGRIDHLSMCVDNIEESYRMLLEKGIDFIDKEIQFAPNMFPKGTKWVNFKGPDGEILELNQMIMG